MIWRLALTILILGGVFGGVFGYNYYKQEQTANMMASYAPPPDTVSAAKAEEQSWLETISAVGTVRAVNSVKIESQDPGTIVAVHYRPGQKIEAGQTILEISHEVQSADIAGTHADLVRAENQYRRYQKLYKDGAISAAKLGQLNDELEDTRSRMAAQVRSVQRKGIKAPFAGTLGLSKLDIGQYIAPGQALLRLTQLTPIYIDFTVRQQDYGQVKAGLEVVARVDAFPDREFEGNIVAIDPFFSDQTRQAKVRAVFANKQELLVPGMFVDIEVKGDNNKKYVTIPQTAVTYSLDGDTVFVLQGKGKKTAYGLEYVVQKKLVQVAKTKDNKAALAKGINADEQVVTSGQLKLYEGASVIVDNSLNPALPVKK